VEGNVPVPTNPLDKYTTYEKMPTRIGTMTLTEKEQYFCIDIQDKQPLNINNIFANTHPTILEIGSGKGEFISVYSRFYPDENFIGVELKQRRIINTLKKLAPLKNPNVRLLRHFIDENVTQIIPSDSISEIIINHPDPWPKNKHKKHRLIQHSFLDALHQILKPDGLVKITTDSEIYLKWICKIFAERQDFESLYKGGYTYLVPEFHLQTYFSQQATSHGSKCAFMQYRRDTAYCVR